MQPRDKDSCLLLHLGLVDYQEAWALQKELAQARREGRIGDALLLLEHPHTYTLGRGAREEHLLLTQEELARLGAQVYWVDRGGDITYHGPGQLVGYPILDLRGLFLDAHRYLRTLEEVLIQALADFGIAAQRHPGYTGVWVGEEKIAAIGVKIAHWTTSHGFALNVNTDLDYFSYIVPCGIPDRGVTSMARLLGSPVNLDAVAQRVAHRFGKQFQRRMAPPPIPHPAPFMHLGELAQKLCSKL